MANLRLYPPYGTIEQSSSVKFEICDLSVNKIKIEVENVTDGMKVIVRSLEKKEDCYAGVMDLNIPEHSSQSSISIFATIYSQQEDDTYKILEICPAIFDIKEEFDGVDSNIIITPSFIGQNNLCSIKVKGEPLSSSVFSINDKILRVIINEAGYGSIHFKGKEIIGDKELTSINKIPIYVYEGEHKTSKVFSGSYINILPSNIAIHADEDLRCDPDSDSYVIPGSWERAAECDVIPCDPEVEACDECNPEEENCDPPYVCAQVVDIPISDCKYGDVELYDEHCRIHNNSMTLLNNGMVMYAYTAPDNTYKESSEDSRYNINRVFISGWHTSANVDVLVNRDVIIESKEEDDDFIIHVEEDVWNAINNIGDLSLSANAIYIVFYNAAFGYQKARITGILLDEYTGSYTLVAEAGSTNVVLSSWIFCVNSVIYNYSETPNLYISNEGDFHRSLPFVIDEVEDSTYPQPVNVSISSNCQYIGENRETYIYLIVEAVTENNLSQLYFNSFSYGKDSTFDQKTHGWVRLTDITQGNNRNPVTKMDSYNNLHVIFESDRAGINQIYYGNIGINNILSAASTFSSSIDKYSEFLSTGQVPFDYMKPLLLSVAIDQEYFPIPEYDTQSVLSEKWNIVQSNGGEVSLTETTNYLDNLLITANPLSEEALAITSLKILDDNIDPTDPSSGALILLQYNYQISFDLEATVTQNNDLTSEFIINEVDMDNLYTSWKNTFVVEIDPIISNNPTYIGDDNNKFSIGRVDNVYERIVPLVGSYKYENTTNPSNIDSQIKILKNDNNLKDFTFGLIFEKSYFKASNVQTVDSYVEDGNLISTYISEEKQTIYTGRAKLVAFIKTEDKRSTRADYIIVREFPEALDVSEISSYDIIVNYTKISSDQVENVLNTYDSNYLDKYVGTLTLIIDGTPKFSQSFVASLDFDYNNFDIGFGMPNGGYYVADKMAPSKLGVFDNVSTILNISNITISSPTYTYNHEVVSLPPNVRDITNFKVFSESFPIPSNTTLYTVGDWTDDLITLNFTSKDEIKYFKTHTESAGENYEELFNVENVEKVSIEFLPRVLADNMIITSDDGSVLYETGFVSTFTSDPIKFDVNVTLLDNIYIIVNVGSDINDLSYTFTAYFKKVHNENSFIQTPVTFEGINQSAALDIGNCDDIHIAWQSNRNKYWNIYYSSAVDELSPFRHETQITNTEKNSIKPSISVNRTGKRLIAWNDNRDGDYSIYAARSLEGYDCDQKACENRMLQGFEDQIENYCDISFTFTPSSSGVYDLLLYFHTDVESNNLYKSITLEDNELKWFVNGVSADDIIVYDAEDEFLGISFIENTEYNISYSPDKDDDIFDIILYVKLDTSLVQEEVL